MTKLLPLKKGDRVMFVKDTIPNSIINPQIGATGTVIETNEKESLYTVTLDKSFRYEGRLITDLLFYRNELRKFPVRKSK